MLPSVRLEIDGDTIVLMTMMMLTKEKEKDDTHRQTSTSTHPLQGRHVESQDQLPATRNGPATLLGDAVTICSGEHTGRDGATAATINVMECV